MLRGMFGVFFLMALQPVSGWTAERLVSRMRMADGWGSGPGGGTPPGDRAATGKTEGGGPAAALWGCGPYPPCGQGGKLMLPKGGPARRPVPHPVFTRRARWTGAWLVCGTESGTGGRPEPVPPESSGCPEGCGSKETSSRGGTPGCGGTCVAPGVLVRRWAGGGGGRGPPGCGGTGVAPGVPVRLVAGGGVMAPRGAVAPGWHPGSESGCKPEGKTLRRQQGGSTCGAETGGSLRETRKREAQGGPGAPEPVRLEPG